MENKRQYLVIVSFNDGQKNEIMDSKKAKKVTQSNFLILNSRMNQFWISPEEKREISKLLQEDVSHIQFAI